jgi:hypothetical protein
LLLSHQFYRWIYTKVIEGEARTGAVVLARGLDLKAAPV